jgi:hypothetical protein
VLVLGAGNGRNLPPLATAGLETDVRAAADGLGGMRGSYAGILSTHALLHGTRARVSERVARAAALLAPGGYLLATFGSCADPRCGSGLFVPGEGWAATDGDEPGVSHAYFDHASLARVLRPFASYRSAERDVSTLVGRWAHTARHDGRVPRVHWFVEALR